MLFHAYAQAPVAAVPHAEARVGGGGIRAPLAPYAKSDDLTSDDVWKPVQAALRANPPRAPVSESHAAYGAFYNTPQVR